MRLFIALELGRDIESRIAQEISRLKRHAPNSRWVRDANLHLTLAFLGEVADADVPDVGRVLEEVASHHARLQLRIGDSGTFGPLSHPKVLWLCVTEARDRLHPLQRELAQALAGLGHLPDHDTYEPHVTLARAKHPRGDRALATCADSLRGQQWGTAEVGELVLFQSTPGRDGSQYTSVVRAPLQVGLAS